MDDRQLTVRQKFERLLSKGYSAVSAVKMHKHDLQMMYQDDDYFNRMADSNYCPSLKWCRSLQEIVHVNQTSTYESLAIRLKQQVKIYNRKCGQVSILAMIVNQDELSIAIVTPLMRRNHRFNPRAAEVVYIVSSDKMAKNQSYVYQISTETEAGGIPLGILITSSNSEPLLNQALNQYKKLIGWSGHFGCGERGPLLWVSNGCRALEKAWKYHFPASFLILSPCEIVRCAWKKLKQEKVPQHERHILISNLKTLVLSTNETELNNNMTAIKNNLTVRRHQTFISYVNDLLPLHQHWALFHRAGLVMCQEHFDVCQVFLRATMDVTFDRLKYLNVVQMCAFVFDRLENYYEQRLMNAFNGVNGSDIWYRCVIGNRPIQKDEIVVMGNGVYFICGDDDNWLEVDSCIGTCECVDGMRGVPCQHHYELFKWYGVNMFGKTELRTEHETQLLMKLANCCSQQTETESVVSEADSESQAENVLCNSVQKLTLKIKPVPNEQLIDDVKEKLTSFSYDLKQMCCDDPESNLPAVLDFLKSYEKVKKNSKLLLALHTFGKNV